MSAARLGHAALALALALPIAHAGVAAPLAGDLLFGLPPEAVARRSLENLPSTRIGALNRQLAGAEQARLAAGPGEWTLRAGVGRRTALETERYREQEVLLERSVRWFGKAQQDRAIGATGVELAEAERADRWHEAGRALMRDWYDALRAQAAVRLLYEQQAALRRMSQIAARRVAAGEAARLDLIQAETALERGGVVLEEARLRQRQAESLLSTTYPGLPMPDLDALPEPPALSIAHADQLARLLEDNHELALARTEAQWLGLKAARAASERMPDPTVTLRSTRERDGQERTYGVMLSIPLPGAARNAEHTAATLRAEMARERGEQVKAKVALAAEQAVNEQEASYRIWQGLAAAALRSGQQAELMAKAYQANECTIAEVLLSRRQALDAALAALTGRIDALASQARVQLDAHALWSFD